MREVIADLMHQRWVHWMKYLFEVSTEDPNGVVTIPKEKVARWKRQMATNYSNLSSQEQSSDLAEADYFLEYIKNILYKNKKDGDDSSLFNIPPLLIEINSETLFEQYKLYVELSDKISERRHSANSFFLTANGVLVTAITTLASLNQEFSTSLIWLTIPSIVGMAFSVSWWFLIRSYKQLNDGKFKIIHRLETLLPANLFFAEWEILKRGDGSIYTPFTRVESYIPIVFFMIYLVLVLIPFVIN